MKLFGSQQVTKDRYNTLLVLHSSSSSLSAPAWLSAGVTGFCRFPARGCSGPSPAYSPSLQRRDHLARPQSLFPICTPFCPPSFHPAPRLLCSMALASSCCSAELAWPFLAPEAPLLLRSCSIPALSPCLAVHLPPGQMLGACSRQLSTEQQLPQGCPAPAVPAPPLPWTPACISLLWIS